MTPSPRQKRPTTRYTPSAAPRHTRGAPSAALEAFERFEALLASTDPDTLSPSDLGPEADPALRATHAQRLFLQAGFPPEVVRFEPSDVAGAVRVRTPRPHLPDILYTADPLGRRLLRARLAFRELLDHAFPACARCQDDEEGDPLPPAWYLL